MSDRTVSSPGPALDRPAALITGASRRVGLAIARAFAAAGCDLILTYHTSRDDAESAAADLRSLTGVDLHPLDLSDPGAVEAFGAAIAASSPRLDILIHNAAAYAPTPLATFSADEALRFFRINALAPALLTKHLAPLLARSPRPGGGSVVAMSDIHALGDGSLPRTDFLAYAMSKAALTEMVRTLARELAPAVRVNAVAPGVVAWPESGPEAEDGGRAQAAYLKRVPLARAGTPEDAAEAVRWLALDAHYITGEILRLDGGRSLR